MWWQTIISGTNKHFIANKIMKEVSSDGATVSPFQPLPSETLQSFYQTSLPLLTNTPIATLRTTCLFAGRNGRNCFPVYRSSCVFTSSLYNCLRIRVPGHSLCNKRWILAMLVDSSTSTLRISNSVYIMECQLISRDIILWLGISRSGNAQFW